MKSVRHTATPPPAAGRRVVLLGRVSRGERQQDPESQLGPLRAAAVRLGWTVVHELGLKMGAWDDGAAAQVRRLALAPIEAGQADTLMIWAWDRYSREGIEGAFRHLRYLEDHLGAQLWSLQEPFLCTAAPREQRELLLSIIAWAAKWESQRKSERLRARVVLKRSRAGALGQRARWGRGVVATTSEVDRVSELHSSGLSVRQIAVELGVSKSQVGRLLVQIASCPDT